MPRKKAPKKPPKKAASPAKRATSKTPTKTAPAKRSASKGPAQPPIAKPAAAADSKQAKLIAMLSTAKGATIEQMMQLTGWQAHSVRGVLSGALKKRLGMAIESTKDATGARVYRIVGAAT